MSAVSGNWCSSSSVSLNLLVVQSRLAIQLDEHQRDGRVAQRTWQMADVPAGIRSRTLVFAERGVAWPHFDPVSVHRLDEPAARGDDSLRRWIFMPLSDPSLRELRDHDVNWRVRQPVYKDRFDGSSPRYRPRPASSYEAVG